MAEGQPTRALAIREPREQTIRVLIENFAADRLTVEELEERLDAAHRATTRAELSALTADLPAAAEAAPAQPAATAAARNAEPREREVLVAIMGGVEKRGPWSPARRSFVLAIMGGAQLDLREAILPTGVTEIVIFTIWGGVEIIVKPGTRVESDGFAIMGAFEHMPDPKPVDSDSPVIRISGLALMAGVEVHARYPGESEREAKQRRRQEQHRLREQRRIEGGGAG